METEEIWKESKVYKGYLVSNKGRVAKIKSICRNSRGYCHTKVGDEKRLIHRLVAEVFLKKKKGQDQINHIDGNIENNHVENLEWCTQAENSRHAFSVLHKSSKRKCVARLDVKTGTTVIYPSVAEAERKNNISVCLLRNYIRKQTLVNGKYTFSYAEDVDYKELF